MYHRTVECPYKKYTYTVHNTRYTMVCHHLTNEMSHRVSHLEIHSQAKYTYTLKGFERVRVFGVGV